ncbi:hypothetical protein ABZP36_027015 [Zizania latifolia]
MGILVLEEGGYHQRTEAVEEGDTDAIEKFSKRTVKVTKQHNEVINPAITIRRSQHEVINSAITFYNYNTLHINVQQQRTYLLCLLYFLMTS